MEWRFRFVNSCGAGWESSNETLLRRGLQPVASVCYSASGRACTPPPRRRMSHAIAAYDYTYDYAIGGVLDDSSDVAAGRAAGRARSDLREYPPGAARSPELGC